MYIRTLVILLLNFTMAFGNNETTVFRQLASYNSRSSASSIEQWYPSNQTQEQLKATAEAYLDLLKGNQEMAGSKLESIYTTLKNESGVDIKLAIYVDRALGYSQFMDGNLDSAYVHYWPALLLIREQYGTKSPIYIDQLRLVIELFRAQGKLGVAQEMLSTLHDLSKKVYGKEDAKTIEVLALLGSIGTEMARFDVAEGYFNQCNQLTENASTDPELTAKAMNLVYQSDFYLTKGNFTVAEALNNEALKTLEHIYPDFHPTKSQAYLLKAKIYIAMNNLNEAGETLSELIAFQRSYYGENHPVLAKSQLELADVLIQQGFASSSQDLLQNCQSILEPSVGTSHADYCRLLILKAQAISEEDPLKAKGYFLESITTLEKNYGKSHFYLAKALSSYSTFLYQANNLKTAEKQERKALEIRTTLFDFYHPDYANSLFMLAKINLKAGNKKEASIYLKKSAENYLIQYNKYFAFLSEYEKSQFYERTSAFFDLYYYYAFFETSKDEQQAWINQVFDYRLANKALLFQSVKNLKEAIYDLNDPSLMEAYLLWIKTKENLSKLNKVDHQTLAKSGLDKDSLLELSNELEKKISLKVAVSKNNKRDMDLLNWQTLANSLSEDEMAIEIIRIRDFDINSGQFTDSVRYALLALNQRMNNGPKLVMLENGNQMESKHLKTYRNLVKFKMADERSYDVFVKPLIEGFNRDLRQNIYMSPDGVYNQINLNTLLNTETNEYFINEYNLLLLSSLRDLIKEDKPNYQSNSSSSEFYFFGYPNYQYNPLKGETEESQPTSTEDGGERSIHFQMKNMISRGAEITLLPGTLEEVEAASEIVSDHVEEQVITGNDATEERVKALESPGLLHIATHGFFLNEDPPKTEPHISDDLTTIQLTNPFINPLFNSGLMLTGAAHAYDSLVLLKELVAIQSGGIAEDGIMTSYEVMNISLRDTKLVILSACETGLGKVKSGEGVYGLQRAFQTAGADAVVISLWKVSDAATKDLMILFYKNYVEGKAPRDAFVAAQQELKTKYESPYYWGAFIFVGGSSSEGMIKQAL